MVKVELDDDVFGEIQQLAEPLVDDVNSVLRRVFQELKGDGLPVKREGPPLSPRPRRAAPGSILSEREYEAPILIELLERGGSGQAAEVTEAVGKRLADRLTPRDHENLDSGDVRWKNRVAFTRLTLRKRGLLRDDSPRGIWALTDEGWSAARKAMGSA